MTAFFWLTIVGGFLKFLHSVREQDVQVLDVVALVYASILFVVMLVTGSSPP